MTGPATTVPVTMLLAGTAAALTRPATARAPRGNQKRPRSRSSSWLAGASLVGVVGVIWLPMPWPALLVGACASCRPYWLASGDMVWPASCHGLPSEDSGATAPSAAWAVSATTPACSPGGSASSSCSGSGAGVPCSGVGSAAPFFLIVLAASRAGANTALPLCAGMRAAVMGLAGALLTMGTPVTEGVAGFAPDQADRAV